MIAENNYSHYIFRLFFCLINVRYSVLCMLQEWKPQFIVFQEMYFSNHWVLFFFLYFKPRIYGQNTMHTRIYSQFFFLWLLFSATAYSSPEYDKWFTWFVTWSLDEWPKMRMEIMQMYHINLATISVKFKQHRLTSIARLFLLFSELNSIN